METILVSMETIHRDIAPHTAPSSLDSHLGFWLRTVSNHVSSRFATLLAAQGCSVTDWVALRILFDKPNATHADLIHGLRMTKGAASKVLSRLEEMQLVIRHLAEGSAREQLLRLSRKGRGLVPRLAMLADENERHFFGHLEARERKSLMETFQTLATHHRLPGPPIS
jgi:DNA-binding MarR family transcriptional regulator